MFHDVILDIRQSKVIFLHQLYYKTRQMQVLYHTLSNEAYLL